jgi:hypothetical protein
MQNLMNPMEPLMRRLQAITNREGNQRKHYPEEKYIQWALFRAKII